ncbi:MAG: glycerate kinase type-2 family protein [Rhodospirillales bacterium]
MSPSLRVEGDGVALLRSLFDSAVAAAQPACCVPDKLPECGAGRVLVIGAGKASAAMARAVEEAWPEANLRGLVVTRYGYGVPCDRIEIAEASHPVPDEAGERAARRMLSLVGGLSAADLVLCLISGGGSALLSLPAKGLTLADKQAVNLALLRSGANIEEMNCLRKHLSAIKGGRLAAATAPARLVTLAISDVPGDDPGVIASGPTVPDPTTFADARAVIAKYGITLPPNVLRHLNGDHEETPKPGDARLNNTAFRLVATPGMALAAAAETVRAAGLRPLVLGDDLEGEARVLAREHARLALKAEPGTVLLSGGETTVTLKGAGRGGRNSEYALALALALDGAPGISAIACDTDGIDGSEDNAGALIRPGTLALGRSMGLEASAFLADNDAYSYFEAIDGLVHSGPTMTNVNDFRAILIT